MFNSLLKNKKGMEIWQLVLIVIAVLLLIFLIVFYGDLNTKVKTTLGGLKNIL